MFRDIRSFFATGNIRNVLIYKIIKVIKHNIRNLVKDKEKEEHYYKPIRVSNFRSNNQIEEESKGDRNKALSGK